MKENTLQLTLVLQAIIFSCRNQEIHDYPFQIFSYTHCSDTHTPLPLTSINLPRKQYPNPKRRTSKEVVITWTNTQEFAGRCEDARQADNGKLPENTTKHAESNPEQVTIDNLILFKLFCTNFFFFFFQLPDWEAAKFCKIWSEHVSVPGRNLETSDLWLKHCHLKWEKKFLNFSESFIHM